MGLQKKDSINMESLLRTQLMSTRQPPANKLTSSLSIRSTIYEIFPLLPSITIS